MKVSIRLLFFILLSAVRFSTAQIITPLYVGNINPVFDNYNRVSRDGNLIEIRTSVDGIIRPPDTNGVSHYKNPLLKSSFVGINAMPKIGLFCEVFPNRIGASYVFGRIFNSRSIKTSTFYCDSQIYQIDPKASSLVFSFSKAVPLNPFDDDEDGLNNSWEMELGTYGYNTSDFDGDGVSDLNEMIAGTDPSDKSSVFKIISCDSSHIKWSSVPLKTYRIQATDNLLAPFSNIFDCITASTNDLELIKTLSDTNSRKFYRIVICSE